MRVAVVYSGIPRFDWEENLHRHRKIFPDWFETFYTCWDHHQVSPYAYVGIPQPRIEYHPWYDCQDSEFWQLLQECKNPDKGVNPRDRWLREHTLQHIGHALAIERLNKHYIDVVIRMRYDMRISDQVDWAHWCRKVFLENRPAGFWFSAKRGDHKKNPDPDWIHFQKKWDARFLHMDTRVALQQHGYIEQENLDHVYGVSNVPLLPDAMLIHRSSHFNVGKVKEKWSTGRIRPAEFGWYQLLVEENFGPRSNHAIKMVGGGYKTW